MKENSIKNERSSIEAYVKILEKFSNENVIYGSTVGMTLEKYKDLQLSAEHILSDYKRVLEMNEVLLKDNEELNKKTKEQKECTFREDGTEECLWHCSNCHDEWIFYEGAPEENNLKYCPHCGAKVIKYESYIETEIEIANKMVKDYLKESEE